MGKSTDDGFKISSHLNKVDFGLLFAIQTLKIDHQLQQTRAMDRYMNAAMGRCNNPTYFNRPPAESDRLFQSDYPHPAGEPNCENCSSDRIVGRRERARAGATADAPMIWYGTIGTADHVLRFARQRDRLGREEGILCIDMEAGGVIETLPALVVRGVCDYADSHKNKEWQPYAALAAAAYAKELLNHVAQIPDETPHGSHCLLGTVLLDDVQRAFAEDPKGFRNDVWELVTTMPNPELPLFERRLPLFRDFLQKHRLQNQVTTWVAVDPRNQLFDGYNLDSGMAARDDRGREPRDRLAAARALAYLYANANGHFLATMYLVQDTVLKIWDYIKSKE
ncbi:hypothetical protein VTH82DRAFT_3340 [Thermothelomyces myriococcoides]